MERIGYKIKLLHNRIKGTLHQSDTFQKSTITRTEYMVLNFVMSQKHPQCMKDVQEHFNINRSTSSELLTSLETKGYVEKIADDHDSRIKYIKVTNLGKKEYSKIVKEFDRIDQEIMNCLTEEERAELNRLFDKVLENFKKGELDEKVCLCKNKK